MRPGAQREVSSSRIGLDRPEPRPGERHLLVVEVEVLTRLETPWGPQFMVAVPRPVELEDFASEQSLLRIVPYAGEVG